METAKSCNNSVITFFKEFFLKYNSKMFWHNQNV